MTAQTLLSALTSRGVILSADGGQLAFDGPDEVLTDEVLVALKENKAALLELLTSDAEEPVEVCPICAGELKEQRGNTFNHIWCPRSGHFDAWRADGDRRLSDSDAPIVRVRGTQ